MFKVKVFVVSTSPSFPSLPCLGFLLFKKLKIGSSIIQYIFTTFLLPSIFPAPPHLLFLRYTPYLFLLQKRADLQKMTAKWNKTRYHKTRQNPSYWDWTKQPNRRKWVPRAGKRIRNIHAPTTRNPTKDPAKNKTIGSEDSMKNPMFVASVSVNPCEPYLVDWVTHVLPVFSIYSDS